MCKITCHLHLCSSSILTYTLGGVGYTWWCLCVKDQDGLSGFRLQPGSAGYCGHSLNKAAARRSLCLCDSTFHIYKKKLKIWNRIFVRQNNIWLHCFRLPSRFYSSGLLMFCDCCNNEGSDGVIVSDCVDRRVNTRVSRWRCVCVHMCEVVCGERERFELLTISIQIQLDLITWM